MGYSPWGHKRVRHNLATKPPELFLLTELPLLHLSTLRSEGVILLLDLNRFTNIRKARNNHSDLWPLDMLNWPSGDLRYMLLASVLSDPLLKCVQSSHLPAD